MRSAFSLLILGSIALFSIPGKASAQNLPTVKKNPAKEPPLKDSIKDTKTDLPRLIELLQGTGADDKLEGTIPLRFGFASEPPIKFAEEGAIGKGKNWIHRECAIIYSTDTNGASPSSTKIPSCFYIYQVKATAQDNKGYWFLTNLDGELQKAITVAGKNDESGSPIHGSGVYTEQDVTSPEVLKTFKAEMTYWTKDWLKKQQKLAVKVGAAKDSTNTATKVPEK